MTCIRPSQSSLPCSSPIEYVRFAQQCDRISSLTLHDEGALKYHSAFAMDLSLTNPLLGWLYDVVNGIYVAFIRNRGPKAPKQTGAACDTLVWLPAKIVARSCVLVDRKLKDGKRTCFLVLSNQTTRDEASVNSKATESAGVPSRNIPIRPEAEVNDCLCFDQ
jgi:hypothetical protein